MFPLPRFDYLAPTSLQEACSLLADHAGSAALLAGGTDLLPALKQRSRTASVVIDLRLIPRLRGIEKSAEGYLTIGPLTSLRALAESDIIQAHFPGLAQAADSAATPQIRNMGTVGGNIALNTRCSYFNQSQAWLASFEPCFKRGGTCCHAVPGSKGCHAFYAADIAVMLVALHAALTVITPEGRNQCSLESIYTHNGASPFNLGNNGIIAEIRVPLPPPDGISTYRKLRLRHAIDFPLVSAAINLAIDRKNNTADIAVVLGAVAPGPVIVENVFDQASGIPLKKKNLKEIGMRAASCAKPVANAPLSPAYRRTMASVLTTAALEDALKQLENKKNKGD